MPVSVVAAHPVVVAAHPVAVEAAVVAHPAPVAVEAARPVITPVIAHPVVTSNTTATAPSQAGAPECFDFPTSILLIAGAVILTLIGARLINRIFN